MTSQPIERLDDGRANHLVGQPLPELSLTTTSGGDVHLPTHSAGRWVLFIYPRTGVPGEAEPDGWASIPGATGCTAEACSFRDNLAELLSAGAEMVAGLSVQSTAYQQEAVQRLHLPYPLLSDAEGRLTAALRLPTFEASGLKLLTRMTLVIDAGVISHVFYPVHPAEGHAEVVREWLLAHPVGASAA
jgi:peroxiredoxin